MIRKLIDTPSVTLSTHRNKEVVYLSFPHFDKTGSVLHGFSTKHGGISSGVFESMNLSKSRGDLNFAVDENFNRFSAAIGVRRESLVFSDQIHEAVVRKVGLEDVGKGLDITSDIIGVDGLMTDQVGVTLVTFYADCVPLFFLDPKRKVIALSHAGWRGTVKGIGKITVDQMMETYDCNPSDILVGIGPSIGQCCYEVSQDVINEFENRGDHDIIDKIAKKVDEKHYMLNLHEANKIGLLEAGIPLENIVVTDVCTKCYSDDFYSHRVMGSERGSLAAMLSLA